MPSTRFKLKPPPLPTEAAAQSMFFDWIDKIGCAKWPELRWAYAIPNYSGRYNYQTHAWYLAQGKRPGVPDICVPCPVHSIDIEGITVIYHGLYIEMKRSAKDHLKPEQVAYRDYLISAGYAYARCNSGQEAIAVIEAYMMGRFVQDDADQGHKD